MVFMIAYMFVVIGSMSSKERLNQLRQYEDFKGSSLSDKIGIAVRLAYGELEFPKVEADLDDGQTLPPGDDIIQWIIACFNGIVVVITLLNLLVGILGNVYDDFQENKLKNDLHVMVNMIKEVDSFYSVVLCKGRKIKFLKFLLGKRKLNLSRKILQSHRDYEKYSKIKILKKCREVFESLSIRDCE